MVLTVAVGINLGKGKLISALVSIISMFYGNILINKTSLILTRNTKIAIIELRKKEKKKLPKIFFNI